MEEFIIKSKQKLRSIYSIGLLTALSVLISIVIFKAGVVAGFIAVGGIFVLLLLLLIFNNYRDGFLLVVVYSFLMFHLYRILPPSLASFPMGVIVELLLVLIFISVLMHKLHASDNKLDSRLYKNPVSYALMAFVGYTILLLLHPSSRSIMGRVFAIREIIVFSLSFYIVIHVFQSFKFIKFFLKFWIFFAVMAAIYGIYQEIFGLQDWELRWLNSNPETAKLAFVWGHVRKWSFLSDINAFGLFMSYSGIICIILAIGPFSFPKRIILAVSGVLMLVSMTFSGTRTAMAMIAFGFLFYVVHSLNKMTTIIAGSILVVCFLGIYYGPFYGGTFSRIRSTTNVSNDASMNVRKQTRARVQPYILSHPFGGGLNTSGKSGLLNEPDHPLAGNWDPDSGYLKTALERGWIGLLIQLGFYATILIVGLINYYRATDPTVKIIYSAYLSGFFALSVANFAQDSMDQKPVNLILMASVATIIKLSTLTMNKSNV